MILSNLPLLPGQSEPVSFYPYTQKSALTAWPIRACILPPGFLEACSYLLANQSLSNYLKSLVQKPGQLEPVSSYLDSQQPALTAWQSEPISSNLDSQKPAPTGQSQPVSYLHNSL
jgi:hypothetical protein